MMATTGSSNAKTIVNRELLAALKACPACNRPFALGERVVLACGQWAGPMRFIHESEAVYETDVATYVERGCGKADQTAVGCCLNWLSI